MNRFKPLILAVIVAGLVLVYLSLFTVHEAEKALKFRLGEIIAADFEPGLHFKTPLINNVRKFDARVQTLDEEPQRFLTVEKKNVIVDAFVKWRVGDVRTYYVTVGGDPDRANLRLSEIIKNGLRNEFGKRTIREVVSGDRVQIMQVLQQEATEAAISLGLNVLDVRIKRIDLPEDVSESVFNRMAAERDRVAREFRAEGHEAAERIRADADRQRQILLAEARRDAQKVRGDGDAQSAEIYANAYSGQREFYSFYRSLEAYRDTFQEPDDLIVLSPESDFFRYFDALKPSAPGGEAAQPTKSAQSAPAGQSGR